MLAVAACGERQTPTPPPSSATPESPAPPDDLKKGEALLAPLLKEEGTSWLVTMKELYPEQYREVARNMGEIVHEGNSIPNARRELSVALAPFMQQKRQAALAASDDTLVEYLRLNSIVNDRLMLEDVKACNDLPKGQLDPSIELPDATWDAMSDATRQLLIAAKEGEKNPNPPPPVQLTPDDFAQWRVAMVRIGATDDTFAKISDPIQKASVTPAEKCQIRSLMTKSALQLPTPFGAKLARTLLASKPGA